MLLFWDTTPANGQGAELTVHQVIDGGKAIGSFIEAGLQQSDFSNTSLTQEINRRLKRCFNLADEVFHQTLEPQQALLNAYMTLLDIVNALHQRVPEAEKDVVRYDYKMALGNINFRRALVMFRWHQFDYQFCYKAQHYFIEAREYVNKASNEHWLAVHLEGKCLRELERYQYYYDPDYMVASHAAHKKFFDTVKGIQQLPQLDRLGCNILLDAAINRGRCWQNIQKFAKAEEIYLQLMRQFENWSGEQGNEVPFPRLQKVAPQNQPSKDEKKTHKLQTMVNLMICKINGSLDYRGAIELAEAIETEDPGNIDGKNNWGEALRKQGHLLEAIKKYDEVIKQLRKNAQDRKHPTGGRSSENRFALLGKAKAQIKQGQLDAAESILTHLREHFPQDQEIQLWQGICFRNRKQISQAISLLEEVCGPHPVLRLGTVGLKAYNVLGSCYLERDPAKAIKYYRTILSHIRADIRAQKYIGWCQQLLGKYSDALQTYELLAPKIDSNLNSQNRAYRFHYITLHNNMGQCNMHKGNLPVALKHFSKVLREERDNNRALCCAAWCYRHLPLEAQAQQNSPHKIEDVESWMGEIWKDWDGKPSDYIARAVWLAQRANALEIFNSDTASEYVLCLIAALKKDPDKYQSDLSSWLKSVPDHTILSLEALVALSSVEKNFSELGDNYALIRPPRWDGAGEQVAALTYCKGYQKLSRTEQGKLLQKVYQLQYAMQKLKTHLRVSSKLGVTYRHYTRLPTLVSLLSQNGETPPRFRISNVASMNDFAEGQSFFDALERAAKPNEFCRAYWEREEETSSSMRNVYISSFSSKADDIYMWGLYADDGMGYNLVFEQGFFDLKENYPQKFIPFYEEGNNYPLYRVVYLPREDPDGQWQTKEKETLEHLKSIDSVLHEFERLLQAAPSPLSENEQAKWGEYLISQLSPEEQGVIRSLLVGMLDQVRYLFKYDEYSSEEEVRSVVVTTNYHIDDKGKPRKDGTKSMDVPYVYTEIEKDIRLEEVCLGPKAPKVPETITWLYATKKVERVTRSKCHYR